MMNSSEQLISENEWVVMDRIIFCAAHYAPKLEKCKEINDHCITLRLSLFAESCGYTNEIHRKLFHNTNLGNRRLMENISISWGKMESDQN